MKGESRCRPASGDLLSSSSTFVHLSRCPVTTEKKQGCQWLEQDWVKCWQTEQHHFFYSGYNCIEITYMSSISSHTFFKLICIALRLHSNNLGVNSNKFWVFFIYLFFYKLYNFINFILFRQYVSQISKQI